MKMAILLSEPDIVDAFKAEAGKFDIEFVIADKECPAADAYESIVRSGAALVICAPGLARELAALDIPVLPLHESTDVSGVLSAAAAVMRRFELSSAAERACFTSSFCGILRIDRDGVITAANEQARRILDRKSEMIVGRYLLNIIQPLDKRLMDAALIDGESVFTLASGARNSRLMINIEPIKCGGGICGAVLALQKGESQTPRAGSMGVDSCAEANERFGSLSGSSAEFTALVKKAKHAAYTDAPVLLHGENGTEKLELAEYIHSCSPRSAGSFVELDCSAMTAERINEILFEPAGPGGECLVERLSGGTLFLNHIDELSQELQFKICRVIIGQMPVYGRIDQRIDVRVIAGTNRSLRTMVKQKLFRDDLYYALNVIPLQIPPLRERRENIDEYVDYFVGYYSGVYQKPVQLCSGAYECIRSRRWAGNVKELQNFCQRLVLGASRRSISEAQVRAAFDDDMEQPDSPDENDEQPAAPRDPEAEVILQSLRRNHGSRGQTAKELGISTTTLWRKMQKHGICDE